MTASRSVLTKLNWQLVTGYPLLFVCRGKGQEAGNDTLEWGAGAQPMETELFWGPRLAPPRSFVHPFVALSNKNYDRLSHMLSLRRGPEPQSPRCPQFSAAVLKNQESTVESRESRVENRESRVA